MQSLITKIIPKTSDGGSLVEGWSGKIMEITFRKKKANNKA